MSCLLYTSIFARYEKMGIVGNNGTGKSTFIKMLMGEVEPDSGCFDVGETVRFGYYSQDGLQFDEQMKVIDVVCTIGAFSNLKELLQSKGDEFSPETGTELVRRKVKKLVSTEACKHPLFDRYGAYRKSCNPPVP